MPQTEDADGFLVDAIRRGDHRAWQQLIERYQGRLMAFAKSRLRDAGDAEDAVQEALLGFVTSLKHYDASRSLETYLFAILRYKIGESISRRAKRAEFTAGFDVDDDSTGVIEPADADTPSSVAAAAERDVRQEAMLAKILRRLIEESRDRGKLEDLEVIESLFFVGMRNKEAAELLDRDEKAVAGVKFRAIARLQEFLAELTADQRSNLQEQALSADATISRVWRRHRLSCLKRGTIGTYLLGALEEPWRSYTRFHLETVRCLMCRANLEDLSRESEQAGAAFAEQLFQSSVGFLSRTT